ncbi:hypothetical protein [Streptomyces gobiensis]|uniref:hypothetical protein n=1 Tax=Streptomyces gobiensis TaxID=2875706 RepID=UPI001E374276|nr:hypothetical protein [Streptomyces gobiensis]UGY91728.1 hypothetical protein test1122_08330 [Streptomyces gobiensis]
MSSLLQGGQARQALGKTVTVAALALLGLGYALQLLGVLLAGAALVVGGAVLGVLLETLVLWRHRWLFRRLGVIQLTFPVRQLARDALFLGGLVRLDALRPTPSGAWLLAAVLGCWALHFLCQAVAAAVRRSRRLPIVTRNIDASELRLTAAPPRLFGKLGSHRLLGVSLVITAGMAATAGTGSAVWGALAAGACGGWLLAGTAYLASWLLPGKRAVNEELVLAWLDRWLTEYQPTVGMYFSGGTGSAYQANMWLSTLARLEGRPLIVLRERFMVQKIGVTDIPVVCIPRVSPLLDLERSTLKVLLHPANSGKTSQVLRIPTIKHAFVNHGESDKLSSCNPYAKAYDQIWVAGPAARERYQRADVGIDDRDVVEVGRPQLAPIRQYAGPPPADGWTTVLYAPTWEGWTNEPGNTSIMLAGESIVRTLLADPKVRLLYKPHPMTGSVAPAAREADQHIRALIAGANVRRATEHGERPGRRAAAELARRTGELEALTATAFRAGADEVERMLIQSTPDSGRPQRVEEATTAWEAAYWTALPQWEHQVITGPRPTLYSCFDQADLLISDVSSVISDYLASEKPYAVANTTGLDESDFKARCPTVRAAAVLSPTAEEIPALLAAVRDPAKDSLAAARIELKAHLLGPSDPPSLVRFNQAVLSLSAETDARNARLSPRLSLGPQVLAGALEDGNGP